MSATCPSGGTLSREVEAEVGDADLAAVIGAVAGQQPGFAGHEGQRVAGADRVAVRPAGIGIEPGRAVERQQRAAVAGGQPVRRRDPVGVASFRRSCQADAEQAVDDQRKRRVVRDLRQRGAAGVAVALPGSGRVGGKGGRVGGEDDAHVEEALAQQVGGLEGVAAVVAGAGQDQDGAAAIAGEFGRPLGGGGAGALHQRFAGMLLFGQAQAGTEVEGSVHTPDFIAKLAPGQADGGRVDGHRVVDPARVAACHGQRQRRPARLALREDQAVAGGEAGETERKAAEAVVVEGIGAGEVDDQVGTGDVEGDVEAFAQAQQVGVVATAVGQFDVEVAGLLGERENCARRGSRR